MAFGGIPHTRNGVKSVWQLFGPGDGDRQPLLLPPSSVTRLQQTRLHRQIGLAGDRLQLWADNPWRRLSLQVITLLGGFFMGGTVGMVTGAISYLDPIAALACVALMELSVRTRRALLQQSGDRLTLQLIDAARTGFLYGLLLDGFKLL